MKPSKLATLTLLLCSSITLAQIYKWQDESGTIHFGDDPPEGVNAQPMSMPEGPTEEDAERTRQHLQEMGEIYDRAATAAGEVETAEETTADDVAEPGSPALEYPDCFTRLSTLVSGRHAESYEPITPTELSAAQQRELIELFSPKGGRWRGTMHELSCHKGTPENPARILTFHLRTVMTWDPRISRLTIDSDSVAGASRIKETLIKYLEVGDALYFYDWRAYGRPGNDNRDLRKPGNRIELLGLGDGRVSFLLKRRQKNISRSEVRLLEFSTNRMTMTEQYFYSQELTGATLWVLER